MVTVPTSLTEVSRGHFGVNFLYLAGYCCQNRHGHTRRSRQVDDAMMVEDAGVTTVQYADKYIERVAILSHNSSSNCNMLCWAAACYLDGSELVFYNEFDQECPDCGTIGTVESYPSAVSGFGSEILPKPSSPLVIREASGHQWHHHIPA